MQKTPPTRPTATRTLSPEELVLVAKASRWLSADPARSYREACRKFGLPRSLQAHLRARRDAERQGAPLPTRETPAFMYVAAWLDPRAGENAFGVIKVGITLRKKKPAQAVPGRLREHAAFLNRPPDAVVSWAGSREMEARIVKALKAKHHYARREWFLLRPGAVSHIARISGRDLAEINALLEPHR